MSYRFKFESLLNHRRFIEESIQRDLALAKRHLCDEEENLERILIKERHALLDLKQKQQEMMRAQEFLLCQSFLARISIEIEQQHIKIDEAQARVESIREKLIEAVKKRETLEKLKENDFDAYTRNLLKNEQDCLNETAVIRFYHNQVENRK